MIQLFSPKILQLKYITSSSMKKVTTQPKYLNRSPSQIPIWEGMFQKSFTLHY
jgi:hypothetical protein